METALVAKGPLCFSPIARTVAWMRSQTHIYRTVWCINLAFPERNEWDHLTGAVLVRRETVWHQREVIAAPSCVQRVSRHRKPSTTAECHNTHFRTHSGNGNGTNVWEMAVAKAVCNSVMRSTLRPAISCNRSARRS